MPSRYLSTTPVKSLHTEPTYDIAFVVATVSIDKGHHDPLVLRKHETWEPQP